MFTVIWTVKQEGLNVVIRTRKRKGIEEKDRKITVALFRLFETMDYLTNKYLDKEVLFATE